MTTSGRGLIAACGVGVLLGAPAAAANGDRARAFLAATFDLSPADLAHLDRGAVVSRTLDASDKREVATLGVVRVRITPAFYVSQLLDIANFKQDEAILQVGTFRTPPALPDVAGLTLEDADLRSLRDCRVGDCGVQLSEHAIARFQREVDWRRGDAAARANALMREILVDYATRYMAEGPAASMVYADRSTRLDVGKEFAALASPAAGAWTHFPTLHRHLFAFPRSDTADVRDLLYWSKEKVGRRAVATVTHLAIARTTLDSPAEYAVASKQIYGSHYYDASLGLTILLRDHSDPVPATYVAYVNRSRVDVFGGLFGGIARGIVTSKAKGTVAHQLERVKDTLERRFVAGM